MKSEGSTTIYTSAGPVIEGSRGGFLKIRLMMRELTLAQGLTWQLFMRDFKARYRQSALGVLWAFLMPVVTVAMFLLMRNSGILSIPETGVPYPLYAITGLSIWGVFTAGVGASAGSLVNAGSMVVKINFPKISLVIAACIHCLVDFSIRLLLIGGLFFYYGIVPSVSTSALAFLALIPLFGLTLGLGCMLSLVAVLIRDIGNIINLGFTGLLLVTPILYPLREGSFLGRFNYWNPLNYLINVPRDLLLQGRTSDTQPFLLSSMLSLAIFFICWRFFYLAQTKIAERA